MNKIPVYAVLVGNGVLFLFVFEDSIYTVDSLQDLDALWWEKGILKEYTIKTHNIPSFKEFAHTYPFFKHVSNWSMLGDFDD